jgi:hypothetical protein
MISYFFIFVMIVMWCRVLVFDELFRINQENKTHRWKEQKLRNNILEYMGKK